MLNGVVGKRSIIEKRKAKVSSAHERTSVQAIFNFIHVLVFQKQVRNKSTEKNTQREGKVGEGERKKKDKC